MKKTLSLLLVFSVLLSGCGLLKTSTRQMLQLPSRQQARDWRCSPLHQKRRMKALPPPNQQAQLPCTWNRQTRQSMSGRPSI